MFRYLGYDFCCWEIDVFFCFVYLEFLLVFDLFCNMFIGYISLGMLFI